MSKDFPRYGHKKLKRIKSSWRRQRGMHNKVRKSIAGHVKKVKIGYGTKSTKPKLVLIKCKKDLISLKENKNNLRNIKVEFISSLGKKKKLELIKIANEFNIKVNNVREDFVTKVEKEMVERKQEKELAKKKKEEKAKQLEKKANDKEKEKALETKLSDDDKKRQEKEEKDKLLTKKE